MLKININKVVKTLILSDFLFQAGWGLVGPIFAIFITQQIEGGNLKLVGLVTASYWITKSLLQPFIGHYLDKNHGELDDYHVLLVGMFIANLAPLGYVFAYRSWHLIVIELIRAVAMACTIPTWSGIFTRHIDKGKEAFSWSLESTGIGFAVGISGAVGAWLVSLFGFRIVFVLVSILGLISSSTLMLLKKNIFLKNIPTTRFVDREGLPNL